jgi:hypothetical protein
MQSPSRTLPNPKHEEYARLLSKGVKQGEAYVQAGYTKNAGAASHLAKKCAARVQYLHERNSPSAIALPGDTTLAEMGITEEWIVAQYQNIYEKALEVGQLAPANTAVQNIDRLRKSAEQEQESGDKVPENRIDINAIGHVLDKVTDLLNAAKTPPEPKILPMPMRKAIRRTDEG